MKNLIYALTLLITATCLLSCTEEEAIINSKVKVINRSSYSYSDPKIADGLLTSKSKHTYNENKQLISSYYENYTNNNTNIFNVIYLYEGDVMVKRIDITQGKNHPDSITTIFNYDENNRCLSQTEVRSGFTTYHEYDQNGWLIKDSISYPYNDDYQVALHYKNEFGYDTLITNTDKEGRNRNVEHLKYDSKNNIIEAIYSFNDDYLLNKTTSTYDYDSKGRISSTGSLNIIEQENVELARNYSVTNYFYQANDSIDSIIYLQAPDKNAELVKTEKQIFTYEFFEN
jgi:hypothetical protein